MSVALLRHAASSARARPTTYVPVRQLSAVIVVSLPNTQACHHVVVRSEVVHQEVRSGFEERATSRIGLDVEVATGNHRRQEAALSLGVEEDVFTGLLEALRV